MNFKKMADDIGIDEEDFFELAELLIEASLQDLIKVEKELKSDCNFENIAMAAHSIKGASGNVGFSDISNFAVQLEEDAKISNIDGIKEQMSKIKKGIEEIKIAIS